MRRDRPQGIQDNLIGHETRRIKPAITAIVPISYFYPFNHVRAIILNARRNGIKPHRLLRMPVNARKGSLLRKTAKTCNVRFRAIADTAQHFASAFSPLSRLFTNASRFSKNRIFFIVAMPPQRIQVHVFVCVNVFSSLSAWHISQRHIHGNLSGRDTEQRKTNC